MDCASPRSDSTPRRRLPTLSSTTETVTNMMAVWYKGNKFFSSRADEGGALRRSLLGRCRRFRLAFNDYASAGHNRDWFGVVAFDHQLQLKFAL